MQKIQLLTLSLVASAPIVAERFVTAAGEPADLGGNAIGLSESDAAVGELFPAIALGTGIATAGGAFALGDYVQVGADGKAVKQTSGIAVAVALQPANADGDRVEVFLLANAPQPANA